MSRLLFRAYHSGIWHYDETDRDPADISTFRAVCGVRHQARFAGHQISDELPGSMCKRCYRYITGAKKPTQPVKLELKAIKGGTESWRPEWME
jgi:hypothetical protein